MATPAISKRNAPSWRPRFLTSGRGTRWTYQDVNKYEYNCGELVCFYSRLAEQAEVEVIDKLFNPPPGKGHLSKCIRDGEGKLVGLVRAWTDETRGIIYDIAVSPEHREEKAGRALLDCLIRSEPKRVWSGNPFRIAGYLDRALATLRILYAISFVFGFQKMGEAIYYLLFQDHSQLVFSRGVKALLWLLVPALALFGFRFFWAMGSIRRFVLYRIYVLQPPRRSTLMLQMAVLFSFPVIFFLLCRLFQDFCSTLSLAFFARRFVLVFSVLLLLNTLWLWVLTLRTKPKEGVANDGWGRNTADRWWLTNNFVCGAIALLLWLFRGHLSDMALVSSGAVVLLVNGLVDLLFTGEAYILGDAFMGG